MKNDETYEQPVITDVELPEGIEATAPGGNVYWTV